MPSHYWKSAMSIITTRRHALAYCVIGTSGLLFAPAIVRATERRRVLRLGVVNPAHSAPGQACLAFAAAASNTPVLAEHISVEVHANGELGGEVEMVRACAAGAVDLVFAASNVVAGLVPELALFDAPFLFRDAAHARATLDGPVGAEYVELLARQDLGLLAWGENGVRHVTANRPIRHPDDLKGLRIRVPQSEMMRQGFVALGANPETLPFPQVYEALRTGRFAAQENPIATIVATRFAQVQRCLNLTAHAYSAAFFLASPDLFEGMSADQADALRRCAVIGAQASRDAGSSGEDQGLEQLRNDGMQIISDVDRAALAAKAKPVIELAARRFGADRVARIQDS